MKSTVLTQLPIVPEEYEADFLTNVDWSKLHSMMSPQQRAFVNGLIRYYHPEHVLELGVKRGGGTVNILNAIKDWPDSKLTSIDLVEYVYSDVPVGDDVKEIFPHLSENKWELLAGKDPSEAMEFLGKTFDFVVIDTAHVHPIESLNFLSTLPYLRDGAIVVLHDISLHLLSENEKARSFIAPRVLLSAVVSPKIEGNERPVSNIAAFQITEDTRKYIGNVFDALFLPWEIYHRRVVSSVRRILEKHYSVELLNKFDVASNLNENYIRFGSNSFKPDLLNRIPANTVFYGAGQEMDNIIKIFNKMNIPFQFPIWDRNSSIKEINGHPVTTPDFENQVPQNSIAVVTIADGNTFDKVRAQLESVGYTVFHGLKALLNPPSGT